MLPDIKIYVNFLQHVPQTQPIQSVLKKFKSRCYVPYNTLQLPAMNFWMFTTDYLWHWSSSLYRLIDSAMNACILPSTIILSNNPVEDINNAAIYALYLRAVLRKPIYILYYLLCAMYL
jgi:hypothetical protein